MENAGFESNDLLNVASSRVDSSSFMNNSATDATESAKPTGVDGSGGLELGSRVNASRRPETDRPSDDVRGLGHGIRAVTLPKEPACSRTGNSTR